MIKIGILEDHPLVSDGLRRLIESQQDLNLAFLDSTAFSLIKYLEKELLDVLILDLNLPEVSGFEVLRVLRRKFPRVKVCVLSSYQDSGTIKRVFAEGALGYVSKDTESSEILDAIGSISNGQKYIAKKFDNTEDFSETLKSELIPISEREENVLRLICKGKTTKQIADILQISVNTVNNHRKSILKKTGVENIVGLLKYGFEYGYMD